MKFQNFKNLVRDYPFISGSLLGMLGEDERILRNQLSRWQTQQLIVKLKKGLYLLNPNDRRFQPSQFFLSNQLQFASYVSLESALAYYHIIPEAVYQVSGVTTGKPTQYVTPAGTFTYRHLQPSLFFGFTNVDDERKLPVMLATPEKALLDFFYLNLAQFSVSDSSIFTGSYRLAGQEILYPDKLKEFAARFKSKKLQQVVNLFVEAQLPGDKSA